MTTRTFLWQLLWVSLLAVLLVFGLHQITVLTPYSALSWISIAGFVGFSLLLFGMGTKGAKSSNNHLFVQLFLVATLLKMLLCILLIWWYFKSWQPQTHLFVIPFFVIYSIYTSFEVYFLGKLAKSAPAPAAP